jgi:putative RNA 2'-phosphotransferase
MIPHARLVKLSKLLSLMLRHEPQRFALSLDPEGFVAINEVLAAASKLMGNVHVDELRQMIKTIDPDKNRFSIVDDDIRANYGHSLATRIEHVEANPPHRLWHGTHEKAVDSILLSGLTPMRRQYVHLTTDRDLALSVGGRRGKARLLSIDAGSAHQSGIRFYRANDSFWLVDSMPARFIQASR